MSSCLPTERVGKLYATGVKEKKAKTYKMTVRSKGTHSTETIKQLLKEKQI